MGLKTEFVFTAQCDGCKVKFTPAPRGDSNFSNVLDLRASLTRYYWEVTNMGNVYCPDCHTRNYFKTAEGLK